MIGGGFLANILIVGLGLFSPEMPQMVEAAGRMTGRDTEVETRNGPEGPLVYHWLNAAAGPGADPRAALASGRVDQLLLTEPMPLIDNLSRYHGVEYAARFRNLALRGNPGAQTYIYESWPPLIRGDHDAWRREVIDNGALWQAFVDAVNADDRTGPDAPPARLIPLARGLVALDEAIHAGRVPGLDDLDQLFRDDHRLNERGTYFAALLVHAFVSGSDPTGLPVWLGRNRPATLEEALTEPMARAMQRIAWQVVSTGGGADRGDGDMLRRARSVIGRSVADDRGLAPWQEPDASYLGGIEQRGMGFNLSGIADWSAAQPFLDVFKTARPWIGHLPGQWGGVEEQALREGGYLDAQGWPLRMPPKVTGLTTVLLTGLDARMISAAGRYVLRYRGRGRIEVGGESVSNVEYADGRVAFDYMPGGDSVFIHVRRIDPQNPIREISVVRQDRLVLADSGQIFNPDFLARLRGAELLRFVEWGRTNNSQLVTPEDLPTVADYIWSSDRGVPPEVMVALANELDLDPWFTVPHLANDELIRAYARRVRDNLEPGRRAWVEFSNELWNGGYAQRVWAETQARAAWGVDGAGIQYAAWRAARMADIWAEEFAPSTAGRLVRVISTFTGAPGAEEEMLNAPAWQAADPDGWSALADRFDAYAISGDLAVNLGEAQRLIPLQATLADSRAEAERRAAAQGLTGAARDAFVRRHRFDRAIDAALAELRGGALSGQDEGTLNWMVNRIFSYHRQAARRVGLDLVMYAGGSRVVMDGEAAAGEELQDFLTALTYSPGLGDLYRDLIGAWRRVSDQPFNHYTAFNGPGRHGSRGLLRFLDDENPRWDAVAEAWK